MFVNIIVGILSLFAMYYFLRHTAKEVKEGNDWIDRKNKIDEGPFESEYLQHPFNRDLDTELKCENDRCCFACTEECSKNLNFICPECGAELVDKDE